MKLLLRRLIVITLIWGCLPFAIQALVAMTREVSTVPGIVRTRADWLAEPALITAAILARKAAARAEKGRPSFRRSRAIEAATFPAATILVVVTGAWGAIIRASAETMAGPTLALVIMFVGAAFGWRLVSSLKGRSRTSRRQERARSRSACEGASRVDESGGAADLQECGLRNAQLSARVDRSTARVRPEHLDHEGKLRIPNLETDPGLPPIK